jgi:hypothetical protein
MARGGRPSRPRPHRSLIGTEVEVDTEALTEDGSGQRLLVIGGSMEVDGDRL